MVLEGLAENEEFWTMDLSDDEVLIRNSTPDNASKSVYLCVSSHRAEISAGDATRGVQGAIALGGLNADKQVEEKRSLTRPERLPNGKYRYW
jgi:hypothetical protein